jgi:hypothetical protein
MAETVTSAVPLREYRLAGYLYIAYIAYIAHIAYIVGGAAGPHERSRPRSTRHLGGIPHS